MTALSRIYTSSVSQFWARKPAPQAQLPRMTIQYLFRELFIHKIFNYLTLGELAKASRVCKDWHAMASDPIVWSHVDFHALFKYNVFGADEWNRYIEVGESGLEFDDLEPMMDCEIGREVARFYHSLTQRGCAIVGDLGVTVLTIPKNLKFDILHDICASPEEIAIPFLHPVLSDMLDDLLFSEIRAVKVERAYRVIIANNVVAKSIEQYKAYQEVLVESLDCEFPSVLEAFTNAIMARISSSAILYGSNSLYCRDIFENRRVYMGLYAQNGMTVGLGHYTWTKTFGLVPVRKIPSAPSPDKSFLERENEKLQLVWYGAGMHI